MAKSQKKIDLTKEAAAANGQEEVASITDGMLWEICPDPATLKRLKAAKTPAARADLLYELDKNELKELRNAYKAMDAFVSKLEAWFVQEFRDSQTGVTGKVGRVEVKNKEVAIVEDWTKFYAHIAKKKEFDLLNKALNQKAVQERWEQHKEVAGIGKFIKKVISLTGVK